MCHCNGEMVAHLLLHCETTFGLWSRALGFFGIQWVLPGMVTDLLLGWWKWLGKHSSDIWNLIPLCLMWLLWRERNCRTFKDMERSPDELEAAFFWTLFDWSQAWGFMHGNSILDFVSSLNTCA